MSNIKNELDLASKMIIDLNTFIHCNNKKFDYHMKHIQLTRKYALILNGKLDAQLSGRKLSYIALAHDLFKERSLDPTKDNVVWNDYNIPQDTTRYVRMNLDILEKFGLDDYFNTDIQYHALTAGIFLYKELGVTDPEILYPVFFHSCPIIPVYSTLNGRIKNYVDIIMLADKLSSNHIKISMGRPCMFDLDLAVFGTSGKEFNYTMGLYMARLISQGDSKEKQSVLSTEFYYEMLCKINPIMSKSYNPKQGGTRNWLKRKSQVLMTYLKNLRA